ncbi:hypothetical protein [Argonema galeatum]|nr:hypothetical protein [Argonema galeatum]
MDADEQRAKRDRAASLTHFTKALPMIYLLPKKVTGQVVLIRQMF